MNLLEGLRVALRGLASNKMRTALTMLGMIIGVGVVIVVVAIGEGATQRVTETVNSLGTNLLSVSTNRNRLRVGTVTSRAATTTNGATANSVAPNRLTLADANAIAKNFPQTVERVAPQIDSGVQVRLDSVDANTDVIGTTGDYLYVKNTDVARGRFFTPEEQEGSFKVCVAGTTIAEHLTGDASTDLTGKILAINRQKFRVVGMLAPKGATSWGQDQDDVILVPITTAMRRVLNRHFSTTCSIRCTTQDMMPLAQEQISNFCATATTLRRRSRTTTTSTSAARPN